MSLVIVGGNKTEYILQGDKVIYEMYSELNTQTSTYVDVYNIMYTYDYDGKIISFNYNGIEYYYIRNQQGDITKIVDNDGNIVLEYQYDAWGNILNWDDIKTNSIAQVNPYTYRGYRYDSEISMYYLNSRFYNPTVGRFINSDGLLGTPGNTLGHNMYAYTQNNPVMYTDPSGYLVLLTFAFGALVFGGLNFLTQMASGKEFSEVKWKDVIISAVVGGVVTLATMGLGSSIKFTIKTIELTLIYSGLIEGLIHAVDISNNKPNYALNNTSSCQGSNEGLNSMYYFTDLASGFLGAFRSGITNSFIENEEYNNIFPECQGG